MLTFAMCDLSPRFKRPAMQLIKTELDGPLVLVPRIFGDDRGYFFESFSERDFERETGLAGIRFVQDNESFSGKGVLRGLHFQKGAFAQAKLVRVVRGAVQDVAVDLRPDSPTFGRWVSVLLTGENKHCFYIPKGFAHGFLVLEHDTIFQYKCDAFYEPSAEGSIRWNDPDLNIEWMDLGGDVRLSEKDQRAPLWKEFLKELGQ